MTPQLTISTPESGITLDQLYEQAKSIRSDVESVNITEWLSAAGREHKFYVFTDDDAFLSSTPEGVLADLLASTKTRQVA
jgi:hypothetical protein